jgi:glycosyltransferase involved in cell wall biosynthesis
MRRKLEVVYVTHDSLSEGIGMSQIVPVLLGLSKSGFSVGVISCEKRKPSTQLIEMLSDQNIFWKPIRFGRNGAIGGVGRILRLALNLPLASVYHCRGDISATATSIRTRKPFLWDVRGLWLDQKIILSNLQKNYLVIFFAKLLEKRSAIKASAVSTLTAAVYPVLRARNPKMTSKHSVIPTCTDLNKFTLSPSLPTENTLLLSGVFNNYYDLDITRRFIQKCKESMNVSVVWCHGIEAERSELGVGESTVKVLTQMEMPAEITNSSFGLAICKEHVGESLLGVMPTKVAEFLATGRPVVVSRGIGDLDFMLSEFKAGVVLNSENLDESVAELKALLRDPSTPVRCRELAEKHFSMELAVQKYAAVLRGLIDSI